VDHSLDPQPSAAALEAQADRAAQAGDATAARCLLEQAVALEPGRSDTWMKLAAMCRATQDLQGALEAVAGALRVNPLDFVPLLLKANLLDRLGQRGLAGELYGYALAQAPETIPAPLASMAAEAGRRHSEHLAETAGRFRAASAAAEAGLDPDEKARFARFQTNVLRETRPFHSEPTHFHYPGLREREYHERRHFPWLAELEAATDAIRSDFERVMAAERAELVPYIQYPDDVPVRQWAELNGNRAWTAIHLVRDGVVVEANARHCPATMALLGGLDQPEVPRRGPNAMFSLLAPGAHIPPHTGVSNTRLVCHLALIVPDGCWFRVGAETRPWEVGKAWVFDDTIEHEALNPSESLRVVLIVDTWHPDLSAGEREAVASILAASDAADAMEGL